MTLKVAGIEIPGSGGDVRFNGNPVDILKFNGETVWKRIIVPSGTVIFESSTPGSYSVNIQEPGNYIITAVGGGGGAAAYAYCYGVSASNWWGMTSGGGSGAYFVGTYTLPIGSLSLTVGDRGVGNGLYKTTDSSTSGSATGGTGTATIVGEYITANPGMGGAVLYKSATGGAGGTLSYSSTNLVSTSTHVNGGTGYTSIQQGVDRTTEAGGSTMNSSTNGSTNGSGYGNGGGASCSGWITQNPIGPAASYTANHGGYGYIKIVKE